MTATEIQQLVNLSPYGVMLLAIFTLWKAYKASNDARVEDLKQLYEKATIDLQNRVMMIEDRLGVKPPLTTSTLTKIDSP